MQKRLVFTIVFTIITLTSFTQNKPNWIKNKPTPTNSTYRYVVEWATGESEIEARNFAIGEVFRSTAMRIGQPFDSEIIFNALQKGTDYSVISRQFNIPINKVCEYSENDGTQYRVYILCQVAEAGNMVVYFDDFNKCYDNKEGIYGSDALYALDFEIYKNGSKLNEREIRTLFANSISYNLYDRGIRMKDSDAYFTWSRYLIYTGIPFLGLGFWMDAVLDTSINEMYIYGACFAGVGIALFITGELRPLIGKAKIRKAVNLYNNSRMYSSLELNFGLTGDGLYLSLTF